MSQEADKKALKDSVPEKQISLDEYFDISRALEQYHALFYKFWEMGKPIFDKSMGTCGVRFNEKGRFVEFVFNPDFWDRLSQPERIFILCHECLHLLLNHGERARGIFMAASQQICNIAMDVAVNHMLVNSFGFVRADLPVAKEGCWVDTVFPKNPNMPTDESFEYYYNRLINQMACSIKKQLGGCGSPMDDHTQLEKCDVAEIVDALQNALSDEEKQSLTQKIDLRKEQKQSRAGTTPLGKIMEVPNVPVQKKSVWKSIVRKHTKKWYADNQSEQWARVNRRFAAIESEFILPSEHEVEEFENNRVETWVFLDASGSCQSLKGKFFNMAKSLPEDYFHVRVFSFDTMVHELDLKKAHVVGGGGTSFTTIEKKIQELVRTEKRKYPQAVFVITDGDGDTVHPQHPDRWYWFLSRMCKRHIPAQSHIFE